MPLKFLSNFCEYVHIHVRLLGKDFFQAVISLPGACSGSRRTHMQHHQRKTYHHNSTPHADVIVYPHTHIQCTRVYVFTVGTGMSSSTNTALCCCSDAVYSCFVNLCSEDTCIHAHNYLLCVDKLCFKSAHVTHVIRVMCIA